MIFFPHQYTHTVVLMHVHYLYFKRAFQKHFSSSRITRQIWRKSRPQINGLKIDHSAVWLWRWYLSALSLPFGHHIKDYATSQDLSVYANHHLIAPQPIPPQLNISNRMRVSCSPTVAGSSLSITWYMQCTVHYSEIISRYRQCGLMQMLIRLGRCSAAETSRLLQTCFRLFLF